MVQVQVSASDGLKCGRADLIAGTVEPCRQMDRWQFFRYLDYRVQANPFNYVNRAR